MKYGVVVPFSDARLTVGLAREIEDAGWDGMFLPELVWGVDPWAQLAAAAAGTQRIRLGTMLTPLPWLRPWTVASQVAAVDHISNGRAILAVGLGAPDAGARGFAPLEMDRKARAELLDEGLDVLTRLWSGEEFGYEGQHYRVDPTPFSSNTRSEGMPPPPPPVQRPRVPVWVVGVLGSRRSLGRVLRYDGLLPAVKTPEGGRQATADELAAVTAGLRERRDGEPFDIVVEGETQSSADDAEVRAFEASGATWWIESRWALPSTEAGAAELRKRIVAGPPRGG